MPIRRILNEPYKINQPSNPKLLEHKKQTNAAESINSADVPILIEVSISKASATLADSKSVKAPTAALAPATLVTALSHPLHGHQSLHSRKSPLTPESS